MTATTPVERVADALVAANFTRMPTPLVIAGLTIPVASAFVGSGLSPDLVIVSDTLHDSQKRIQQTVEGVGRALDMVQSRRPLSLVLVGPRPDSASLAAMSRFARVLPVGEVADQAAIANWLAVLLPLTLPPTKEGVVNVKEILGMAVADDEMSQAFLEAAQAGEDAVRDHFHALIEAAFNDQDSDAENNEVEVGEADEGLI